MLNQYTSPSIHESCFFFLYKSNNVKNVNDFNLPIALNDFTNRLNTIKYSLL